jgi:hypothetical protein
MFRKLIQEYPKSSFISPTELSDCVAKDKVIMIIGFKQSDFKDVERNLYLLTAPPGSNFIWMALFNTRQHWSSQHTLNESLKLMDSIYVVEYLSDIPELVDTIEKEHGTQS